MLLVKVGDDREQVSAKLARSFADSQRGGCRGLFQGAEKGWAHVYGVGILFRKSCWRLHVPRGFALFVKQIIFSLRLAFQVDKICNRFLFIVKEIDTQHYERIIT